MSLTHYTWFIVPEENMTGGRFAALMESFRDLPNSIIHEYKPDDPEERLFASGPYTSPVIDGFDLYTFDSSTTYDSRYESNVPKGVDIFSVATEGKQFLNDAARSDAYVSILGRFFSGLGAMYAVGGSEYSFEEFDSIMDLKKVVEGVHIFSDGLVEIVGRKKIEGLGRTEDIEGGLILRTSVDDIYGVVDDETKFKTILNKIWKEVQVLSSKDFKKFPESKYNDIPFPSGRFAWFIHRGDLDVREASRGYYEELLTLDASEEEQRRGKWLIPEDIDKLVEDVGSGKCVVARLSIAYSEPLVKPATIGPSVLVTAGLPGVKTYGAWYERESAVTVLLNLTADMFPSLTALRLYVKHFRPIYGMGHDGLDVMHSRTGSRVLPESRIWPINVFDLDVFGSEFEKRIVAFWTENADRWMLKYLADRTVALITIPSNELEIPDLEEATRSIFGDMMDLSHPIKGSLQGGSHYTGGGAP